MRLFICSIFLLSVATVQVLLLPGLEVRRTGWRMKRKMAEFPLLWTNHTIPYMFVSPLPDKPSVLAGIRHWQEHTCLKFHQTADKELPHIAFRGSDGCRSGVGRELPMGQNVSIGDTCNRLGIVVHEIGHAIGFYHEIRRPDRDKHVVINTENILPDEQFNFAKLYRIHTDVKYDLSSVMHYNSMEWSSKGKVTVATIDPMLQGVLGIWKKNHQRGLSHRDKLTVNSAYGCIDDWIASCNISADFCKGESYLGRNCECVCPPGTEGLRCDVTTASYYSDLLPSCNQKVAYRTVISSPNYPKNYREGSWCVFVLHSDECRAPVVTITDFRMSPRDSTDQCSYDYLEIRTNSSNHGDVFCDRDITPGRVFKATSSKMILFFNGESGSFRGFQARVHFEDIEGCCRKIVDGSKVYWLSPKYPQKPGKDFRCEITYQKTPPPSKLNVALSILSNGRKSPCPLVLCLPGGYCSSGSEATLLTFERMKSKCHRTIYLRKGANESQTLVVPELTDEDTACELRFQSAESHVMLTINSLQLMGDEGYLAVDEAGTGLFETNTTRVYRDLLVREFVSVNNSLALVLNGGRGTNLTLTYSLYDCRDSREKCQYWSLDGECVKNRAWMEVHCPYSCKQCKFTRECTDRHTECIYWAKKGQCQDNKRWMKVNCRRACGHCDWCDDRHPGCEVWEQKGECARNSPYMRTSCPNSCKLCLDSPVNSSFIESDVDGDVTVIELETRPEIGELKKERADLANKYTFFGEQKIEDEKLNATTVEGTDLGETSQLVSKEQNANTYLSLLTTVNSMSSSIISTMGTFINEYVFTKRMEEKECVDVDGDPSDLIPDNVSEEEDSVNEVTFGMTDNSRTDLSERHKVKYSQMGGDLGGRYSSPLASFRNQLKPTNRNMTSGKPDIARKNDKKCFRLNGVFMCYSPSKKNNRRVDTNTNVTQKYGTPNTSSVEQEKKMRSRNRGKNRNPAVDIFMTIPLCAEIRKLNERRISPKFDLRNQTQINLKRKKKKLKMYKMLKKIMKPSYMESKSARKLPQSNQRGFNRYFSRNLKRVLKKLFRRRRAKLKRQKKLSLGLHRRIYRRGRKAKEIVQSIRKYNLNKIFKFYRINIRNHVSKHDGPEIPILCIAGNRITREYMKHKTTYWSKKDI